MKNGDVQAAWSYHDGTKHSYWSVRNNLHFLDWANRPLPFKIYPTTEPIALPRDVPQMGVAALAAISARAAAMELAVARASATMVGTGTYCRSAWKYGARRYRRFGWDHGTLLANMLAVAAASGLRAEIVLGFVAAEVNRLLDLDPRC